MTTSALELDSGYYAGKLPVLRDLWGRPDVFLEGGFLKVGDRRYPVLNDVIVLADPAEYSPDVRRAVSSMEKDPPPQDFAEDIQYTFGQEWKNHPRILPEHSTEFRAYFDLVDLGGLRGARVCDLGCGIGRWSYFLKDRCKELVLVDFSDAIFVARKNLAEDRRALFFMGDLRRLPFRRDFCDFLLCLGVLHHLPVPCLDEVRVLSRHAPRLLVFLYYNLDNRPAYYRWILSVVTITRSFLSRIRSKWFRRAFAWGGTFLIYKPLVWTWWDGVDLSPSMNSIGTNRFGGSPKTCTTGFSPASSRGSRARKSKVCGIRIGRWRFPFARPVGISFAGGEGKGEYARIQPNGS